MSDIWNDLAIILKRRNVGETDRLLTIFTKKRGKLMVRARGVRAAKSKRRSYVELFNTIKAQVAEGRGMPILAQTELEADRSGLKEDIKLLRIAYHLVELVDRLTPEHQPQPDVFELLDRALSSIDLMKWRREEYLTGEFEKKLLKLLGYGIPLERNLRDYIEGIVEMRLKSREILKE